MSGLLNALNAGKTSLSTNQKSIEIVGNNIANVNTEGYSRQRAELMQIPAVNFGDFFVGQGVTVSNVRRDHDIFITRQLQEKSIAYGEESGRSVPMQELERIFSISDENLASKIDRFFDSWQKLSTNPSGQVERDMVLQRGKLLGDAFKGVVDELDTVQENINTKITAKLDNINEQIAEIARLNDRIHLVEISGQSANGARDQQELLVKELSHSLGVQTYTDNQGMLAVQLPGGLPLVQGTHAMTIEADTSGSDVNLQVHVAGSTKLLHLRDMGGEMRGMFETRDVFMRGLRDDLDNLAVELTKAVNDVHANGYGLDGTGTQRPFFDDLAGPPVVANAARHIRVALTSSDQVAAAAANPSEPGDNRNALAMSELENTYRINGQDTFDNAFAKIVATVGVEASRNKLALNGARDATVQLQNMRDGFAGVSLEEEMVDLIQYQRGFESSAKFLSVIDEMMNSLLQLKE